jgi:hypothetical protein
MRSLAEVTPPMAGLAQDQCAKKGLCSAGNDPAGIDPMLRTGRHLPAVQSEFEVPLQSPPASPAEAAPLAARPGCSACLTL